MWEFSTFEVHYDGGTWDSRAVLHDSSVRVASAWKGGISVDDSVTVIHAVRRTTRFIAGGLLGLSILE